MPKEVFIEDVIERVVRMSKMQLYNAVYPEFDPVYRADPHNKSVLHCLLRYLSLYFIVFFSYVFCCC